MKRSAEFVKRRKEEIPEIAFGLFAERGIEHVSMQDIADAAGNGITTMYRYFGTKQKLVIEIAALKWRQYAEVVKAAYETAGGDTMTAREEFAFYMDSYIELYKNHKAILRFNASFGAFIAHEKVTAEEIAPYYASIKFYDDKFSVAYQKALQDRTIRTDIPERELYFSVMYTMLFTAARLATGVEYPGDANIDAAAVLELQKNAFMAYMTTTSRGELRSPDYNQ